MPENKIKIFLIVCLVLIAVLSYNDRQNFSRRQSIYKTAVIPSADNVYQAINNEDMPLLEKLFAAGANMEDVSIWQNIDLDTGATKDIKGLTPLGYAVYMNKPKIAEWFIDNGADINAEMPVGGNILSWAITYRMKNVIVKLLKRGGLTFENGYNPADQARLLEQEDIVRLLVSYGIYPKIKKPSETPHLPKKKKTFSELK